jgi:hypothetical protein
MEKKMLSRIKKMFFKTCPKTGRIINVRIENEWLYYLTFPILGILAMIWILVRVIPKPSRLTYPCIKIAMPFASTFLVFITGLILSVFSLRKLRESIHSKRFRFMYAGFLMICLITGFVLIKSSTASRTYATFTATFQPANQPMGEAKGILPGRVAWVHDPAATNAQCTNNPGNGWFLNKNNNQEIIDAMLEVALKEITNQLDVETAWDEIFKYYNFNRGKGTVGYQSGEKIFIKINLTSSWGMGEFWGNIREDFTIVENSWYGISETSPHLILSLLRSLVNVVGVDQTDIYIGDPMRHIYKDRLDLWRNEFPDINYMDHNRTQDGRIAMVPSETARIYYSDRGEVLRTAQGDTVFTDHFYTIFEEMEYMINVPTLKGHERAGITEFAKNHFGSHTRSGAEHLHDGLVNPSGNNPYRAGYGFYRVTTDLMAHSLTGQKNLIYLMDALWSAGMEVAKPSKWQMPPFNNHWSSSIFISQDPVAIASVGYDFLRAEYTADKHPTQTHVQMEGTDEYLHHAADPSTWPEGIIYDPDNTGSPIPSLGVHEHWNNARDRQYSRNLGMEEGIQMVTRDHSNVTQDDTVIVHHVAQLPVFDGIGDDEVWEKAEWQSIGQVWIPYGEFVLSDDFIGRYKAVWNYDENLLCFLVEIIDDVLVDGYQPGDNNYPDFDVLEIFIDEDRSGGMHRIDHGNENSYNAFSYHLALNFPEVGDTTQSFVAMDLAGFWERVDYADHFEHFILKRYNHKLVYEMALKVYDDTYDHNNPEASRVQLMPNKIMGFTMAYCDNDDKEASPPRREKFYGSVWVPEYAYNSHWENADYFGTMKLVDESGHVYVDEHGDYRIPETFKLLQNYPNPFNASTIIQYHLAEQSDVKLTVYDVTGRIVAVLVDENQSGGYYSVSWNAGGFASGIYFFRLQAGQFSEMRKGVLIK